MTEMEKQRTKRWQQIIDRVTAEYRRLVTAEKTWIADRLLKVAQLQERLDQRFQRGNGEQACRDCRGDCCAKGHNHMTLVNLLCYLQADEELPSADFTQTCPFLGEQGCQIVLTARPYPCVSFICDIIEGNMMDDEVKEYYALEQQLRAIYEEFAARYAGAGMTGLLLQEQRLAGREFLSLKPGAGESIAARTTGV